MISDTLKADILKLRGLGYTQEEIAGKLELTQSTVAYHLNEMNKEAQQKGDNATFLKTLADGYLPQMLEMMGKVQEIMGK